MGAYENLETPKGNEPTRVNEGLIKGTCPGNKIWGGCSIQVMGWPRPLGQDCQRGGRKSRREAKEKHVGRWVVKRLNRPQVW